MKDKRREDAWTDNHDVTLAQTVISHIKMEVRNLLHSKNQRVD